MAIKDQCGNAQLEIRESIRGRASQFGFFDWLIYLQYRTLKTFYDCIYYYFLPFVIVMITFITSNNASYKPKDGGGEATL